MMSIVKTLTLNLICRLWCPSLTLTFGSRARHLIYRWWRQHLTLRWEPYTSSHLQMMMSWPYTYLGYLDLHLICRWWRQEFTLTWEAWHIVWSADDDVMTVHLPWKPYTSSDLQNMMSWPYAYLGSLTFHVICRWWSQDHTITLEALHFIWSADQDVKTLHLSWELYTLSDL